MALRPRTITFAAAISLLMNGAGLYLLVLINSHIQAPKQKKQLAVKQIDFTPRKKRRRVRRRVRRRTRKMRAAIKPLAVPNLPSTIQAPGLGAPTLSATSLIKPLFQDSLRKQAKLIFKEEDVDVAPKVVHRVAPRYPSAARNQAISGWVQFQLLIDAYGRVKRARLLGAKPQGVFESAARAAITRWTFSPARYQGRAVPVWFRQRLLFSLR
jgi:TonB family protein